jgi:hypothetical protein
VSAFAESLQGATLAPPRPGLTAPANPDRKGAFLTDVIVELGLADEQTIEEADSRARQSEQRIDQYLVERGILDEEQLSVAIAERNGLDHVDLDVFEVDPTVGEMIGRPAAQRYNAVPIAYDSDGALLVAVEDPLDSLGISDIEVMTRSEVRRVIAAPSAIGRLIEQLPEHQPAPPEIEEDDVEDAAEAEEAVAEDASEAEEDVAISRPPENPAPESPADPFEESPFSRPPPAAAAEPSLSEPPPSEPDPGEDQPETEAPETQAVADDTDVAAELRALREEASRADEAGASILRRLQELEEVEERVEGLEQELAGARRRIEGLESRSSGSGVALEDVREATEMPGQLRKTLEAGAGRSETAP